MSKDYPSPTQLSREGASQPGRRLAELDPDYIPVDERSIEDLLAFTREYSKTLTYYNEQNQPDGDWSNFLPDSWDLSEIGDYLKTPEKCPADKAEHLTQPHFTLLLSFLQLQQHARRQLNGLTERHLEYYYSEILRMARQQAVPDQVDLLLQPAAKRPQAPVPSGSLFSAGKDESGRELLYRTDKQILVNQAQIGELWSVHLNQRITGIREAREEHTGTAKEAILAMLRIALGRPAPGDPLPDYPMGDGNPGRPVDFDCLGELHQLLQFTAENLYLEFFQLRSLMHLKRLREHAQEEGDEWEEVNRLLQKAGQKKTGNNSLALTAVDPSSAAFKSNLKKALGTPDFDGLTEVESLEDLYHRRARKEVQTFIHTRLHFNPWKDFEQMMQLKIKSDYAWAEINRLLTLAGANKRNDPAFSLSDSDPTEFNKHQKEALGSLIFPAFGSIPNINAYYAALQRAEGYFHHSIEKVGLLLSTSIAWVEHLPPEPVGEQWRKVYGLLAEAHREMVYSSRRSELQEINEGPQRFQGMILLALGEKPDNDQQASDFSFLPHLKEFVGKEKEYKFLQQIESMARKSVTLQQWQDAYRIIELAQRVREKLPPPVAYKQEWLNIYPREDAATAETLTALQSKDQPPRWKTFGRIPAQMSETAPPPENLGWALSSPALALTQGKRTLTLTLGFEGGSFDQQKIQQQIKEKSNAFRIELSSEKGWVEPELLSLEAGDYTTLSGHDKSVTQRPLQALKFTLKCSPEMDPITPLPADTVGLNTSGPLLRIMLRQQWGSEHQTHISHYPAFKSLLLVSVHLHSKVEGLSDLSLQNDGGILAPGKPFEPFGLNPAAGSRLYLGHPELNGKRLDELTFNIEWMGVPDKLKEHYKNYGLSTSFSFTTAVSLVDRQVALPLQPTAPLFKSMVKADQAQSIRIRTLKTTIENQKPYLRLLTPPKSDAPAEWERHLRWELNSPDFQHRNYPSVAAGKSLAMAADIANKTTNLAAGDYQVNPPYTPKIKQLTLNYSATQEITVGRQEAETLFHIHPFGYSRVSLREGAAPFLPGYDEEGVLYVGIRDLKPPQSLSVLFQMAEGSANPDVEPAPIQWSYLDTEQWIDLGDGRVLTDGTRGLINSGIIEFDLPPAATGVLLPAQLYWLRATIARNSDGVCDTLAIHSQAVTATLQGDDNAPGHWDEPLAAERIKKPARPLPGIKSVAQPYTSHSGKKAEQNAAFHTHISERLRHKQRALTLWDYEHLVLEQFPQIYRAKCLPADIQHPGRVDLVVIPDMHNKRPFNPFEPKAPTSLLTDIESYLADKLPPFAELQVRNARFIQVQIRAGVRFAKGYDERFYQRRLNDELNRFLSPWAYEEGADITLGTGIYANSLINFIDRREYVDHVVGIKLFTSSNADDFKLVPPPPDGGQGYLVTTQTPDQVLAAARRHVIDIITEQDFEEQSFSGIGHMKLELDFVVG